MQFTKTEASSVYIQLEIIKYAKNMLTPTPEVLLCVLNASFSDPDPSEAPLCLSRKYIVAHLFILFRCYPGTEILKS